MPEIVIYGVLLVTIALYAQAKLSQIAIGVTKIAYADMDPKLKTLLDSFKPWEITSSWLDNASEEEKLIGKQLLYRIIRIGNYCSVIGAVLCVISYWLSAFMGLHLLAVFVLVTGIVALFVGPSLNMMQIKIRRSATIQRQDRVGEFSGKRIGTRLETIETATGSKTSILWVIVGDRRRDPAQAPQKSIITNWGLQLAKSKGYY